MCVMIMLPDKVAFLHFSQASDLRLMRDTSMDEQKFYKVSRVIVIAID